MSRSTKIPESETKFCTLLRMTKKMRQRIVKMPMRTKATLKGGDMIRGGLVICYDEVR